MKNKEIKFKPSHTIECDEKQSKYIVMLEGPGGSMSQVVGLPNNSYKPIKNMTVPFFTGEFLQSMKVMKPITFLLQF